MAATTTTTKPGELYERAVAYLLSMPRTEKQMRQWYARKTTDATLVDEQIARLKASNLLNDVDYAAAFVQGKRDKLGRELIKTKLRLNGVAPEVVEQAVATIDGQHDLAASCVVKYMRHKEPTPENKSKLLRWLLGRGFEYDLCWEVIDEYWH